MLGVLGIGLMALLTAAGCTTHEAGHFGSMQVSADQECPPPSDDLPLSHPREVVSVDGPGVKEAGFIAQRCCYDGEFTSVEQLNETRYRAATICTLAYYRGDQDEGDVTWCPDVSVEQGVPASVWTNTDDVELTVVSVERLDEGPYLDAVAERTWYCEYPVSVEAPGIAFSPTSSPSPQ